MREFDLINRFFKQSVTNAVLGGGDDCALLSLPPGMHWAVSSDMLVEGRHFLSTVSPALLGHKCLAVNLSDLAACGARPRAFTLSLAMPQAEETWLALFSQGLLGLAREYGCELVGGDTTRGPLTVSITVMGEVPAGQALLRSGAQTGDDIYVSGTLGDARLALEAFRGNVQLPAEAFAQARMRMEKPTARVDLGVALRGIAHSAIDVSDGLLGDLGHVLRASGKGARVDATLARELMAVYPMLMRQGCDWDEAWLHTCVWSGGDDYELVFTAAPHDRAKVAEAARRVATPVSRIGVIEARSGMRLMDAKGHNIARRFSSFDHFA